MLKSLASIALAAVAQADSPMIGTNLGGWLVLEPWITPSLFYRFLGKTHSQGVGMDTWTLCEALGPSEGNSLMRAHYDSWITESQIADLASKEVEIVRLPLGDWTLTPYGPYEGCTDGADEKIDWLLDTCERYGIKVLFDVHGMKGSQNGYDNSGHMSLEWIDETHFKHWSIIEADWMGPWNADTQSYDYIDYHQVKFSVSVVQDLMDRWGHHPALYALEPANEPWYDSDMNVLTKYYKACREVVRKVNPDVLFVFQDAGHTTSAEWNNVWPDDDCENIVLDTHNYMAWNGHDENILNYCSAFREHFDEVQDLKYPIWVGEWALATDICAMWLGGFNDNTMDNQFDCQWVRCPDSYLPYPHGFDFDRTAAQLGPYGERETSTPRYGMCPIDSDFFSFDEVTSLGECVQQVFADNVQAQFIWTARNELEPKWSYKQAYENGWLQSNQSKQFLQ